MAACLRTPQAEQDLLEIWLYIAQDDIAVADKFLDKIEDKCQMLAAHSGTGRLRNELSPNLRSLCAAGAHRALVLPQGARRRNEVQSTKMNLKQAIKDYFRDHPDGLDVTAFVLDRIGHDDFQKYDVRPTGRSFDQAKKDMGKLVKELLDEMFRDVDHLDVVRVDAVQWSKLSRWVRNYTQHRVDPARRKW